MSASMNVAKSEGDYIKILALWTEGLVKTHSYATAREWNS